MRSRQARGRETQGRETSVRERLGTKTPEQGPSRVRVQSRGDRPAPAAGRDDTRGEQLSRDTHTRRTIYALYSRNASVSQMFVRSSSLLLVLVHFRDRAHAEGTRAAVVAGKCECSVAVLLWLRSRAPQQ